MISVVLGFHLCVSRRSLQLTLALVCWCWLGCFLLVSVGELIFDLFLTSSNNLTATVESNAATEKKKTLRSVRQKRRWSWCTLRKFCKDLRLCSFDSASHHMMRKALFT